MARGTLRDGKDGEWGQRKGSHRWRQDGGRMWRKGRGEGNAPNFGSQSVTPLPSPPTQQGGSRCLISEGQWSRKGRGGTRAGARADLAVTTTPLARGGVASPQDWPGVRAPYLQHITHLSLCTGSRWSSLAREVPSPLPSRLHSGQRAPGGFPPQPFAGARLTLPLPPKRLSADAAAKQADTLSLPLPSPPAAAAPAVPVPSSPAPGLPTRGDLTLAATERVRARTLWLCVCARARCRPASPLPGP